MSVYKFRVMYDEDENIYREIEAKPGDSFIDLEECIISAWGLPAENTGVFFLSNDRGVKLKTINHKKPIKSGESSFYPLILHFVEDPHQVFLYESSGKQELGFVIELVIIATEKPERKYPYLLKSNGPSPVKKEDVYKHIAANAVETEAIEGIDEEDESKLLKEFSSEGEDEVTESVLKEETDEEDAENADSDEESSEDENSEESENPFESGFSGSFDED